MSYTDSLIGGLLIGVSAAVLLLLVGRIAGISGIAGSLLGRPDGDTGWRASFIAGLVAGPLILAALTGSRPTVHSLASTPVLVIAGLLVGFGTRLGSGCTSGHGVCGLARLSPRSIAAVATFMVVAMMTVFVVRHVVGAGA